MQYLLSSIINERVPVVRNALPRDHFILCRWTINDQLGSLINRDLWEGPRCKIGQLSLSGPVPQMQARGGRGLNVYRGIGHAPSQPPRCQEERAGERVELAVTLRHDALARRCRISCVSAQSGSERTSASRENAVEEGELREFPDFSWGAAGTWKENMAEGGEGEEEIQFLRTVSDTLFCDLNCKEPLHPNNPDD